MYFIDTEMVYIHNGSDHASASILTQSTGQGVKRAHAHSPYCMRWQTLNIIKLLQTMFFVVQTIVLNCGNGNDQYMRYDFIYSGLGEYCRALAAVASTLVSIPRVWD